MIKILYISLYAFIPLFLLFGCGSSSDKENTEHNSLSPSISNLQFSPKSVAQGSGGGAVTITGSFNYVDPDGNISTITFIDAFGRDTTSAAPTEISGSTSGTINFYLSVDTRVKGNFTGKVYVTDSTGLKSNSLTGAFSVI